MNPENDPRIQAFGEHVREAEKLWSIFERALTAEAWAIDTDRRLAKPGKKDNVSYLKKFRASLGDLRVIRSRHIQARLRFQLHITKGLSIKEAALDAVRELLLKAVGGEQSLRTCPIGPLAQHYLDEIQQAQAWPPAGASPREINLHLSEVWKSVETAIGESALIRRERKDPPPHLVKSFEARQRRERLRAKYFPKSAITKVRQP